MEKQNRPAPLSLALEGRIDSTNAAQWEEKLLQAVGEAPDASFELDAGKLDYISSAGLRVLMKLRRQAGKPFAILDVSPAVYETLDVTGFTELLDVHKALRRIGTEGLELIGRGATAQVFRLDRETVLKVFRPNTSLDLIHQENERSRNAFLYGIPTAISYDIVRVGDCYGTVYELLDAQDFLTLLENDRPHLDEHIRRFAAAMREMHRIEVDPVKFPSVKVGSLRALPLLKGVCTEEELGKLQKLYESIPDRSTFVHGDCHPGNVMVQNGELVFIDLMTCGSGHPVFDLGSMCSAYHLPPKFGSRKDSPLTCHFTEEEGQHIWDVYLRAYLNTNDEELIRRAERQISAISSARTLFASVFLPGLISPERLASMKQTALTYVDGGLEPLAF